MRYAAALTCALLASPALACDLSEVCADTESSFAGQWISEGIRLDWSTDAETSAVLKYRISRWNGSAWVALGEQAAIGSCGTPRPYAYLHLGASSGTYMVEVVEDTGGDGTVVCEATWP